MEIELIKANKINKAVEKRLTERTYLLATTRIELVSVKKQLEQLTLRMNNLPLKIIERNFTHI